MRLSVIIPSRNGGSILGRHLAETVEQARNLAGGAEVLVVDDASDRDLAGTEQAVASAGAPARLIRSAVHQGFAGTCNLGAAQATGDYLFFLNNDMHLEAGCLARLVTLLAVRHDLFAVSPTIVNARGNFVESTTRLVLQRGLYDARFPGREGDPGPGINEERPIDYPCGGAFLCRRRTFLDLGGFAIWLAPFYWEDAELGLRARAHGLGIVETGAARTIHDHAQTISAAYTEQTVKRIYERNRLLMTWRHLQGAESWFVHLLWLGPRWLWAALRLRPFAWALPWALWCRVSTQPRQIPASR